MTLDLSDLDDLLPYVSRLSPEEYNALIDGLPPAVVEVLARQTGGSALDPRPLSPLAQAQALDAGYRTRPHLTHLSDRLAAAVADVEQGRSRRLVVSMPPRMGKSQLTSVSLPTWLLRTHPNWKIGLISHSPSLAVYWGRQVRRQIEEHSASLGIEIARDAGAAADWQTTRGGGITSRSAPGQSITGLGFKVLLIDDIVKDYAAAHSAAGRDALWDWWKANSVTRLEPPALVVVVGTRWHEDDFIGRLLSSEYEGSPADWEVVSFPAFAEADDVLGRRPGDPLLSPIIEETPAEASDRWEDLRTTVGSYMFASLYQQRPAPAQGAIFNTEWWRFWTSDPTLASDDGKVIYLDPETELAAHTTWVDSWDCAFKATDDSDYVVGQRWARKGSRRYLIAQQRGRLSFTQTLEAMRRWGDGQGPYGHRVHTRLVEDKANGTAVIDTLKEQISGLIPVNPTESKTARARAITPECEAGDVLLPYPGQPGHEWVQDLLAELREFDHGLHDDQTDALTQALRRLRTPGRGRFGQPGNQSPPVQRNTTAAAATMTRPIGGNGARPGGPRRANGLNRRIR